MKFLILIRNCIKIIKKIKWTDSITIEFMAAWFRKITVAKNMSIKNKLKVQHLKDVLEKKGIQVEQNGTWLNLFKLREKKLLGIIPNGYERYDERRYGMGNSLTEVTLKLRAQIRRDYCLTVNDGLDNQSFYDAESFMDHEMVTYKKIIYRLSQT